MFKFKFSNILIISICIIGIISLFVFIKGRPREEYYTIHISPIEKYDEYSQENYPILKHEIFYGTIFPLMNLEVSWTTGLNRWDPSYYLAGYREFTITFKNNTNKFLKIVWENSAMIYNKNSSPIYTETQKSFSGIVPPNTTIKKSFHSQYETWYGYDGDTITDWDVKIIICVKTLT